MKPSRIMVNIGDQAESIRRTDEEVHSFYEKDNVSRILTGKKRNNHKRRIKKCRPLICDT